MFKRALALLLTACMMFDSSAITALAAEPQTEVVSEVETEAVETEAVETEATEAEIVETEETEIVSEDVTIEEVTSSELATEEAVTEEETVTEETVVEEETVTEEEAVSEEETVTEETVTEEIATEAIVGTEEVIIEDVVEEIRTQENGFAPFVLGTNSVTLPVAETEQYYSFTAPQTGVYHFYVGMTEAEDSTYLYLYRDEDCIDEIGDGRVNDYRDLSIQTDYMQAGETVYVEMRTYVETGITLDVAIALVPEYAMTKQSDGSYAADTAEYALAILAETGYENVRINAAMTPIGEYEFEGSYYLYCKNMNPDNYLYGSSCWLESYYGYADEEIYSGGQGTEYELYFVLCDEDDMPVAVFTTGEKITTKIANEDQPYVINDVVAKEDSIIMDVEAFTYMDVYYRPADGSDAEYSKYLSGEWEVITYAGLKPGTEYIFEFRNGSTVYGTYRVSTLPSSAEIAFTASYNEEYDYIELNADITGYKGDADYAYVYCEYTNVLGQEKEVFDYQYLGSVESNAETGKTFTVSWDLVVDKFLAGIEQEVTLWVTFDDSLYKKEVITVTIPETEMLEEYINVMVTAGEGSDEADVTISIDGLEEDEYLDGYLYYKLHGETSNMYSSGYSFSVGAEGYTRTFIGIQAGVAYDYAVFVDGVLKEVTATVGEPEVWIEKVDEGENNAFDFVRTYKLETQEELTGSYYIRMEYKKVGESDFNQAGYGTQFTADNDYQVEYKSALKNITLEPDTEYQIKWVLSTSSSYNTGIYTVYETIKTAEHPFTFASSEVTYNSQSFDVSLPAEAVENFSYYSCSVYAYIREEGSDNFSSAGWVNLSASYDYARTLEITGLKPQTNYEVSFRNRDSNSEYIEYALFTFTTLEDTRSVTASVSEAGLNSVELDYTLSGMENVDSTYIYLFVREKTENAVWENVNYTYYYAGNSLTSTFYISYYGNGSLKENTTYEYKIGFSDSYNPTVDSIEQAYTGEFTTLADNRTVTVLEITPYMTGADFRISLSGMEVTNDSVLYMFVRKADTNVEWSTAYAGYYSSNVDDRYISTTYNNLALDSATEYEYKLGFEPETYYQGSMTVELLKNAVSGTFTTTADNRLLTVTSVDVGTSSATVNYSLSGMQGKGTQICLFVREKGTDGEWTLGDYTHESQDREWGYLSTYGYYNALKENTTYEYRLGFSDAYDTNVNTLKKVCVGEFTTMSDTKEFAVASVTPYLKGIRVDYTISKLDGMPSGYVILYAKEKGTEDEWYRYGYSYFSDNTNQTGEVYSGYVAASSSDIQNNTTYEYMVGYAESYNTSPELLKQTVTGEITTKAEDTRSIEDITVKALLDNVKVYITLKDREIVPSTYVDLYIREKGVTEEWTRFAYEEYLDEAPEDEEEYLTSYNSNLKLKENTTYEYQIGYADSYNVGLANLKGIKTGEFTTATDTRAVEVTKVEAEFHNARVYYSLSGIEVVPNGYVFMYIKEKGTEGVWEEVDYNYYNIENSSNYTQFYISSYNNAELKEDTSYEYTIGFGMSWNATYESLKNVEIGEFKTAKDMRQVSVAVAPSYTQTTLDVTFKGNDFRYYSAIVYFYRQKGTESWMRASAYGTYEESVNFTRTMSGLNSGTEYEYAVVVSDDYSCSSPDNVPNGDRKVTGTFTTKQNTYELQFKQGKLAYNKATVEVTATGGEDSLVQVVLYLNDGSSKTVSLKRSNGYKGQVTFENLVGSTDYTITRAEFKVTENNNLISIGSKPCGEFKFTTEKATAPTEVKLNKQKIALNTAYSVAGYNYETLIATITPAAAAKDLIWKSSDESVVTVYQDGTVVANGVGTATITATSKYDEKISASCEVVVATYKVGFAGGNNPEIFDDIVTFGLSKNNVTANSISGLGLYEIDAEDVPTLIDGYQVSTTRSGIATWKDGVVTATGVGETYVVFEKDGVKAAINVHVYLEEVGFRIVGLDSSNSESPAIKNADGSYTLIWDGTTYTVAGIVSPNGQFIADEYDWTLSDTNGRTIVTIDNGVIIPCGNGTVTLTLTPKIDNASRAYNWAEEKITLVVKGRPFSGFATAYAIANVDKKLSDVEFDFNDDIKAFAANQGLSEEQLKTILADWAWKNPNTPLVTNAVSGSAYYFENVYVGKDNYPIESEVQVYIGKITGAYVSEVGTSHKQVLLTSTEDRKDRIVLNVGAIYEGEIRSEDYTVEIPTVKDLTITQEGNNWVITTAKKGNYTIKPVIKVGDKVVASASYKITAVDKVQAASIELKSNTEGVTIDVANNKIIFETTNVVKEKKSFDLSAVVKDSAGNTIDTKLKWSTSDGTVVAVKADKTTHLATVTAKGEGHAVVKVVADDNVKYQVTLDIEIQNHAPRVNTNKATVNTAYDYNNGNGQSLASSAGLVEIVPVYGENIYSDGVCLLDKSGEVSKDLQVVQYNNYNWLVVPRDPDLKNGTYECTMYVTVWKGEKDESYKYPLKVTVTNKKPAVKATMETNVNLFYTNAVGYIKLTGTNGVSVSNLTWEDNDKGVNNGFNVRTYSNYGTYYRLQVSQQPDLNVVKGKLQDKDVVKGTLTVKLNGYKDTFEIKNFTIKTNYKKPSLTCSPASTTIAPELGQTQANFYVYDKTSGSYLSYNAGNTSSMYNFNEFTYDNDDVNLWVNYSAFYYTYEGTKSTKVTINMDSVTWREALSVKHNITVKNPKPVLLGGTVTFNTAHNKENMAYAYIYEDYAGAMQLADIEIKGTNANAQKLVEDDLFVITTNPESGGITIKQNDAVAMGKDPIKAGTYKYKVTPYYISETTGAKKALSALTLSIKIVDKPVTIKVSPSGSIDLSNGINYDVYKKTNVIWIDPKVSNFASGDSIIDYELVGEYSDYFRIGYFYGSYNGNYYQHFCVSVSEYGLGKLRAGQTYKLAVEYTIRTENGDTYTVTSNTFTVKPKQSKPKITVSGNNQTLFAAADNVSRSYTISLPNYYTISSAYGALDCNKDGVADIYVGLSSTSGSYGNRGQLTVRIIDRDGVVATAKGKSYTIPVTVQVQGRDGVTKDATVSLKVTVKR